MNFLRDDDIAGAERRIARLERLGYVDPRLDGPLHRHSLGDRGFEDIFRELPIGLESFDREGETQAISASHLNDRRTRINLQATEFLSK